MKSKNTKTIDDTLRKERKTLLIRLVAIGFLTIVILYAIYLFTLPARIVELEGQVVNVGIRSKQNNSHDNILVIKTKNGKTISVKLPPNHPIRINEKVIINEVTTRLFNFKKYTFVKYTSNIL